MREDAWLTGVLGFEVMRLAPEPSAVDAVRARAGARLLAYTHVDTDDVAAAQALTGAGMFVVDTAVTLAMTAPTTAPEPVGVERAGADDADAIGELAARALRTSRFHLDPHITDTDADAIKRAWARNCVLGGRGLEVLVVRRDGLPAGFLSVAASGGDRLIDLIAVDANYRGQGIGRDLVSAFAARHGGACAALRVGTQAANVSSLAFYAAMGFRPVQTRFALHLHLGAER